MVNSDRGINPVAMTVMPGINIGEAGGSNQRPPVVKSCTLPTELRGSTKKRKTNKNTLPQLKRRHNKL